MKSVKVTLTAKDKGSKDVKKFASNTTTSMGKVSKSTVAANKSFTTMISKFKLLTAAAVTFGAAATLALGKSAVQAASDYQETLGKFSVVFREQTSMAEGFAKELENSYGLSIIESRKYLSSVQDLLKPMGMASTAAAKMSNKVVKLAVDLGSFNNLKTEKVMEDIQSALVGNFETMKKYGVILNETVVKEEAYDSGLVKRGETLNALQKSQAAYTLIVKGSTDALGDFDRTSDSFANQMKILNANMVKFKVLVGEELLPKINEVATAFNKWAKDGDNLKDSVDKLFKVLTVLKNIIISLLSVVVVKKVYNIITSITIAIATAGKLSVAINLLKGRLIHLLLQFKYLSLALLNPIFLAVAVSIAAIGGAMLYAKNETEKAATAMDKYTKSLKAMTAVDLRIKIAEGTSLIIDQQEKLNKLKESSRKRGGIGPRQDMMGTTRRDILNIQKELDVLIAKQNKAKDLLFALTGKKPEPIVTGGATMGDWEIMPAPKQLTFDEQVAAAEEIKRLEQELAAQSVMDAKELAEEKLKTYIEASNAEIEKEKKTQDELLELKKKGSEAATAFNKVKNDTIEQLQESLSVGMTDGLFEWIDGVKSAKDAFLDFASSFLKQIAKMIIQQTILDALQGTSKAGGIVSGVAKLFGYASGGNVSGGTPIIVGEKGPELFTPSRNGAIVPNDKLGGGNNTSITVNVEASGRSPEEAKREGTMIAETIKQQIRQTIQYEQKTNGLLNRQPAF